MRICLGIMVLNNGLVPYRLPNFDKATHYLLDPHVVIIGAGASKAAFKSDKNGKVVPLLRDIHKVLGLTAELEKYGFQNDLLEDFEKLYSFIYNKSEYLKLQKDLENKIFNYFSSLEIPNEVNLYDYLVLSLTSKDVIISFNWDPFLLQSYVRNREVHNLPNLLFLHGNVAVGLCHKCMSKGYIQENCNCGNIYTSTMKLLYPIGKKNYKDGDIIENEWNEAWKYLSKAAGITIFGYGAPESDVDAYNLLRKYFLTSHISEIAPFTIINLESAREEQTKKWKELSSDRMFTYITKFEDSLLWRCPRVSLETIFDAILQGQPRHITKSFKHFHNLKELQKFVTTINEFKLAM